MTRGISPQTYSAVAGKENPARCWTRIEAVNDGRVEPPTRIRTNALGVASLVANGVTVLTVLTVSIGGFPFAAGLLFGGVLSALGLVFALIHLRVARRCSGALFMAVMICGIAASMCWAVVISSAIFSLLLHR